MTGKLTITVDTRKPDGQEVTYEITTDTSGARAEFDTAVVGSIQDAIEDIIDDMLAGHRNHSCEACELARCSNAGMTDEVRDEIMLGDNDGFAKFFNDLLASLAKADTKEDDASAFTDFLRTLN